MTTEQGSMRAENKRTPVFLTVVLGGLLVAALLLFQPYSADFPGTAYAKPARHFIKAAIRHDSIRLVELSASMMPVRWALQSAREHPDTLALWMRRIRAWTGVRRGDTTDVFVYPATDACGGAPIVLRFVGSGHQARVLEAHSTCLPVQ